MGNCGGDSRRNENFYNIRRNSILLRCSRRIFFRKYILVSLERRKDFLSIKKEFSNTNIHSIPKLFFIIAFFFFIQHLSFITLLQHYYILLHIAIRMYCILLLNYRSHPFGKAINRLIYIGDNCFSILARCDETK